MFAFEMVMETGFPDSASGLPFLETYFPKRLRESHAEHFQHHVLRREIVATGAVNHIVNEAGITFLSRMMSETKAGIGDVVTGYIDADREAGARELRAAILAGGLGARDEQEALLEVEAALEASVRDLLAGKKKIDAGKALRALRSRLKL